MGALTNVIAMSASTVTATVTAADFKPILDQLTANAAVIVPAGLGILATMVGIGFIPRILYKFL